MFWPELRTLDEREGTCADGRATQDAIILTSYGFGVKGTLPVSLPVVRRRGSGSSIGHRRSAGERILSGEHQQGG